MTLIAGFRCDDGFIVAADTEVTQGTILFQGHKLASYDSSDLKCLLRVAYAGDTSYGLMASQKVRDAVGRIAKPTFEKVKAAMEGVIRQVFDEQVAGPWASNEERPQLELVVAADVNGEFGVLRSERKAVYEVDHYAFSGIGSDVAAHVAEKLFGARPLSTAVTEHLVQQLFREVKGKGAAVGGNTEIVSRRINQDAEQFFDLPMKSGSRRPGTASVRERFLWGMESMLTSAIRATLDRHYAGTTKDRLDFIREGIKTLREGADKERTNTLLERRTTEYGTPYQNPYEDSLSIGAIPGKDA